MKKDSVFKIAVFSVFAVFALWLVKVLLFPTGYGISINYRMPRYNVIGSEHGFNYGFGVNYTTNQILPILINLLMVVFVIALVIGVVKLIINLVFTQDDIESFRTTFSGKSKQSQITCKECGKALNTEWKVCPHCGKEVEKA